MPLVAFMNERIAEVRAFLDDPHAVMLELLAANEQLPALAKMVVGIGEADESEDLMIGADGAFDAGDDLCAVLHQTLVEAGEQARETFELRELSLRLPPVPPASPPHPDPVPEHRVAEHAERLAQALAPFVRRLVIVIKPLLAGDGMAVTLQLGRVCEALESGRVRLVILSDERQPLVRQAAIRRPRRRAYVEALGGPVGTLAGAARPMAFTGDSMALAPGARDPALRELVADPLVRMLAYDAPARGQRWMQGQLVQLGIDGRTWLAQITALRFFDQAMAYYGMGLQAVIEQLHPQAEHRGRAERSAPLLAAARIPRGEREAELHFVQRLHEYVDAVLEPDERLVVLLCPAAEEGVPQGEWQAFAESVRRLTRELSTPQLALVAVAPGAPGPDEASGAQALRVHRFRIDDQVIEQGLRRKLQEPDLTPLVRLRCVSTLAGFSMARGNPEEGMELSIHALDLAVATNDPNEEGVAWYGLGNALYRCAAFDKALDAYTRATNLAIDQDNVVLAAQSVTGMGNAYYVLGKTKEAIEFYSIARTYYRKLGNQLMQAYVLTWLGESHAKAGAPALAEESYRAAIACCDEAEPSLGEAARGSKSDVLQRMARFYRTRGHEALAQQHLDAARELGPVAPLADEP
jgi:tetratricopeptide (TPR) repeat protein